MNNQHRIACLIVLVASGLLVTATATLAKPQTKVHRIGFLSAAAPVSTWRDYPPGRAFLEGLRDRGYVEGQNLAIEFRTSEGKHERLPEIATELEKLKPDVILVGTCGAPLDAMRGATRTIPIVVAACTADMVATGVVSSLAHPGGNITGTQKLNPELAAKRLALLKEALPRTSRVAVLWDPGYSDFAADWSSMRTAAQTLGIALQSAEVRSASELETAYSAMTGGRADAFITFADVITYVNAKRVADLASERRLPAIFSYREIAEAGGLMSYGPSIPELFRRSSIFIDKILKGAKPGDLPIEQPTKFELVINMKTAKAQGLTIPQSLLLRADKVIE